MFYFLFIFIIILLYILACAFLSRVMYKGEISYYLPINVKKKSKKEGETEEEKMILIHDEFDEFTRRDTPVNYFSLFIGTFLFLLIKLLLSFCIAANLAKKLTKQLKEKKKKNEKLSKEDIQKNIESTKSHTTNFLRTSGIFYYKIRLPDEVVLPVYQKYFGKDYKIDYDGKFGCYICNHTSFNDILLAMAVYGCGFISKKGVKTFPVFGKIAQGLQTIFVDRDNPNSRRDVLEKVMERQKQFYEGEPVMPFMIFPEGTTTSGRHLLRFKKGAFFSLLPIKPNIIHPNLNKDFHLGCGSTDVGINYGRTLTKLYVVTEYIELPIMTPNDYMFENFQNYGKEKWQIYAEVAREIMCTLGGFSKSEKEFMDSYRYAYCMKNKIYIAKEEYMKVSEKNIE